MIDFSDFQVLPYAIAGSCILASLLHVVQARSRRRAHQLHQVGHALTAFYESAELVIDDPSLPESVRKAVELIACALSDRSLAHGVVEKLLSGQLPSDNVDGSIDLDRIFRDNPMAIDNITRAIRSGIFVLFYRWPENAALLERSMTGVAFERREEQRMLKSLVKAAQEISGRRSGDHGGLAAA